MDVIRGFASRPASGARPRLSPRNQRIKAVAAAAFSVTVLIAAGAFVVTYSRNNAAVSQYVSAPTCDLASALSTSCRYVGTATLVRVYSLDRVQAVVAFDSLPGRTFNTSFPVDLAPTTGMNEGSTATAEVWKGRITKLAGASTFDHPKQRPTTSLLYAAAALLALGLLMLFLSWLMAREAWTADRRKPV